MRKESNATFGIQSWDEKTTAELVGGGKLTQADVVKVYRGEIEGQGTLTYLMAYRADGNAAFVGMERVVGAVAGRQGSFIFQHVGAFEAGVAQDTWTVVPESGTGDLAGLRGRVEFSAGHGAEYPIMFDYSFED